MVSVSLLGVVLAADRLLGKQSSGRENVVVARESAAGVWPHSSKLLSLGILELLMLNVNPGPELLFR